MNAILILIGKTFKHFNVVLFTDLILEGLSIILWKHTYSGHGRIIKIHITYASCVMQYVAQTTIRSILPVIDFVGNEFLQLSKIKIEVAPSNIYLISTNLILTDG